MTITKIKQIIQFNAILYNYFTYLSLINNYLSLSILAPYTCFEIFA